MAGNSGGRAKAGEAIPADMRRPEDVAELTSMLAQAKRSKRRDDAKRIAAVLSYIAGRSASETAEKLKTSRSCVNKWMRWYVTSGAEGLLTRDRPGAPSKLTTEQLRELAGMIDAGPVAAGLESGVWTGPMIGHLIQQRFNVRYHFEYVPRLLKRIRYSVQRPRKRLARADLEAQKHWVEETLPR